jgi:hypothetical protein
MAAFITAVVVVVVTAVAGMGSYLYQKRTDHQVDLSKQQQDAYTLYVRSYHDYTFTETSSDEANKAYDSYLRAYYALFPLASDGFLRAAMAFHTFAIEGNPDYNKEATRQKFKESWTKLVVEMRKDANVRSRISETEIVEHVPWSFSSNESVQDGNVDASASRSPQRHAE